MSKPLTFRLPIDARLSGVVRVTRAADKDKPENTRKRGDDGRPDADSKK